MSGICGIVYADAGRPVDPGLLDSMVRALDFSGGKKGMTVCSAPAGLGTQPFSGRLAGAAQLVCQDRPLAMVFHGSLFNLAELITDADRGNPFAGLLRLYLEEGITFLSQLQGTFVLAVWDGREEALYLATDRFRVHPLFYYQDREKLIFSSRMKGIWAGHPDLTRSINPEAIVHVVNSSIIPTPKTIFREIKKLPPGHFLRFRKGAIQITPYWQVSFCHPSAEGESKLAHTLRALFKEAVAACLRIDPSPSLVGSFLSGGVDSSTLTGVMTQLLRQPVKSFSIGFAEERFNEMHYARTAARAFQSEHYEYFVTARDTLEAIPLFVKAMDEPYANASAVPAYYCAKMAREQGVESLYAGDGGDELFAGNERYGVQYILDYYSRVPSWIRRLAKPVVFALADGPGWKAFIKGKKYIQKAALPYYQRISSHDFFNLFPLQELVEEDLLHRLGQEYDLLEMVRYYYFQAPAQDDLNRHLYIDWHLTLADNDLIKVTRMTEMAGVAVRYPFLDSRLVEFSTKVPAGLKMRGGRLRSFQKRAFADLLPPAIRQKKKHGFGLPISFWLRTDRRLNELMHDLLLSPQSLQRGYFRKRALEKLVEEHKRDLTLFWGTVIWHLMMLELWHRHSGGSGW